MDGDRERWNAKWRERAGDLEQPSRFLVDHERLLRKPPGAKAVDIAGGAGRNAIWLARHGYDVTLVDVSDVALDKAEQRARRLGVERHLKLLRADLEEPLPLAPLFDLVVVAHYLDRVRRDSFAALLGGPDGILAVANPTITNLERHASPSKRYLVERGELQQWADRLGLETLAASEDWAPDGAHEAFVIARRGAGLSDDDSSPESGPSDGPYR